MATVRIPSTLADAVEMDARPERRAWLAALPSLVEEIAAKWELELGKPYGPGGQCAWVAPARNRDGDELALKLGWRHREAEHEADGLRFWDGDGAVRCFAATKTPDTSVLLLERCVPGASLKQRPEPEQDVVIAGLARRLHAHELPAVHPFGTLAEMCGLWADSLEQELERAAGAVDTGLARVAIELFRELPQSSVQSVLLCTDLHAENVLSARREPWLVIDPKPFVGDPAFDAVQHMLNCEERLARDPVGLAARMAALLGVDPERVRLWLLARCAQESLASAAMRELARRLVP